MIRNSTTFVNEAKTWIISPAEIQVSFDVVALYPSVPIKNAIINLLEMLKNDLVDFETRTMFKLEHIKELIEVYLYKSYFLWDNKIHSLIDSGPIGLSLMVVLAESYLQKIENCPLSIASNLGIAVTPITHKRYVDDTHDRFLSKIEGETFLEIQ